MNKIYLIISLTVISLFLASCGGGDTHEIGSTGTNTSTTIVVKNCNEFTTIKSGDTLIKDSNSTIVTIVDNSNGDKKVCVDSGSAHILR